MTQGWSDSRPSPRHATYASRGHESYKGWGVSPRARSPRAGDFVAANPLDAPWTCAESLPPDAQRCAQEETMVRRKTLGWLSAALAALALAATAPAQAADPIKIGFGMSLTGPLAANGKMSLLAMQIWEDEVNAKGGLLGRPVKLIFYDDQSSPAAVPAIYSK